MQIAWPRWPHFGRTRTLNAAIYCALVSSSPAGQRENGPVVGARDTVYGSDVHPYVPRVFGKQATANLANTHRQASAAGTFRYGQLMAHTKLLANGNPTDVAPDQSELAHLDLSSYRAIRLSAGNWADSPAPVIIAVSHVDQPNTPNANLITRLDSFTLTPGESASKVYEVPGEVVVFLASPAPPVNGIRVFFTIYGRTD
jgi:hypothetical protein